MSLRADHKALVFVGAVAVLGAGVRVVRAASGSTAIPNAQPALDRQMASADSAAASASSRADRNDSNGRARGRRASSRRRLASVDSADTSAFDPEQGTPSRRRSAGPLDRRGYVGGRLDLDVATAAQIDSLPGITPTIARRIAADRVRRGPFLSLDGLRRVSGIGPTLIKRLDSLVTFSGAYTQAAPQDTTIQPRGHAKGRPRAPTRRGSGGAELMQPAELRTRAPPRGLSRL
jgi:DNA uptake protein ComE-like DNA-binding protein